MNPFEEVMAELTAKFPQLVQQAKDKGELTDDDVIHLLSLPTETDEQLQRAYNELQYFILLNRIRKGAEYIESIDESHPHWRRAHEKLAKLEDELVRLREALREWEHEQAG